MYLDLQHASFEQSGSEPTLSDAWAPASHRQPPPVSAERADRGRQSARVVPRRAAGLMSYEEELSLFRRWKEGGDDRALHALVLAYEPLISSIVGGVRRNANLVQDAKQEARCGLLEAARHFDPEKGFRFGTYARWWILSAVSTYMVANRDVLSSRRMKREPNLVRSHFVSLDAPIAPDGDSLAELIASDDVGPDLIVEQSIDGERMHHRLADALDTLEPRERQILRRRHLGEKPDTLQTIAQDMHITAERVRQIEKAAFARLRNILETYRASRV